MKKVIDQIKETRKKIKTISFDAHWYRRVFHTFGACFLFYYMLPDIDWINVIKYWVPFLIIVFAIILEILRLKGKISNDHFFGLRIYEQKRVGSYLYFGIGALILLLFFPQQIAIPCILCACITDPVMGEMRYRYKKNRSVLVGFLLCMLFFIVSWYNSELWILLLFSIVGASGAVIGEAKKYYWFDDDFTIQIIPAFLLIILFFILTQNGFEISFEQVIYPGNMPW